MKLVTGAGLNVMELVGVALVALAVLVSFWYPSLGRHRFYEFERRLTRVARRRGLAIAIAGLFPVLLRLALLPVYPPPVPWAHDEFCFLLQADTFASGRITNPPHRHWEHFESIYVLSQPTYTAKYQPAQGLVLAAGKLAGCEWAAVLASMGVLCGLLCWMLHGWIPTTWAFFGALIVGLEIGVLSYWTNSYWGGSVAAIGGTLVLGALPRLFGGGRIVHGLLLWFGLAVVLNSRPAEALLLLLIVIAALLQRLWSRRDLTLKLVARNIGLPGALIMLPCIAGMAYYNLRVTGSALKLPYALHIETYGTPQGFFWQRPFTVASFRFPEIRDEYLRQRGLHARRSSPVALTKATVGKLRTWWLFYIGPIGTIPALFLPWSARHPRVRFALWALTPFALCHLTFHAYFPHYSAPVMGLFLILILDGWRRLRVCRWRGQPSGRTLARLLPVVSLVLLMIGAVKASTGYSLTPRERFLRSLQQLDGKHLVFVQYQQPGHHPDDEWVYNRADIDGSNIVWARMWTTESNTKLTQYFANRRIWIAEPDAHPPRLTEKTRTELLAESAHIKTRH